MFGQKKKEKDVDIIQNKLHYFRFRPVFFPFSFQLLSK